VAILILLAAMAADEEKCDDGKKQDSEYHPKNDGKDRRGML